MPTIGIDQVPPNRVRPKLYEDIGYGQGSLLRAILQAMAGGGLGGGGFGQVPTGQSTLNLPGDGTATPGPGLQQQINSGQLPQLVAQGQFPSGTTATQQTRLGMRPNLDYQIKQQQLAKAQQDADPNSPMNVYIRSLAQQATGNGSSAPSSANASPQHLQSIADDALAGDPDAEAAYRYYKRKGLF